MKNKKGAEMTIGTIIIIILALVVLVVLIYGFSAGWSNLWQNMVSFFGGNQVNIQTLVRACQVACSTNAQYDYCTIKRNVVFDQVNGKPSVNNGLHTCQELEASQYNTGLAQCTNVACTQAGAEKGTCFGAVNVNCALGTNNGNANCVAITGCKFHGTDQNNANTGTCEVDTTLKCSDYTNNRDMCDKLHCGWTPLP